MSKLVFVYGSLRRGLHNHHLLRHSRLLSMYRTPPEWTMFSLGGFPALVPGGSCEILGEIYEIDYSIFATLDMLEGYPNFYNRKQIDTPEGKAWVYYIPELREDGYEVVEDGDWVEYLVRCNNVDEE